MKSGWIIATLIATPFAAQNADICAPTDAGLYTLECVNELYSRTARAAFQSAERTCLQVEEDLASTGFQAVPIGSFVFGTRCHISVRPSTHVGDLTELTGNGDTLIPSVRGGDSRVWKLIHSPKFRPKPRTRN